MKRYQYIERLAEFISAETWAEIGVHRGGRAEAVSRRLLKQGREVTYWGYDLWERLVNHGEVYNGKGPSTRREVDQRLSRVREQYPQFRYSLIQGDHSETVPTGFEVDLVFVDGDHRTASIQRDYNRVKHSQVVILDDWYEPEQPGLGSNQVKVRGQERLIRTGDREGISGGEILLRVVTERSDVIDFIDSWEAVK